MNFKNYEAEPNICFDSAEMYFENSETQVFLKAGKLITMIPYVSEEIAKVDKDFIYIQNPQYLKIIGIFQVSQGYHQEIKKFLKQIESNNHENAPFIVVKNKNITNLKLGFEGMWNIPDFLESNFENFLKLNLAPQSKIIGQPNCRSDKESLQHSLIVSNLEQEFSIELEIDLSLPVSKNYYKGIFKILETNKVTSVSLLNDEIKGDEIEGDENSNLLMIRGSDARPKIDSKKVLKTKLLKSRSLKNLTYNNLYDLKGDIFNFKLSNKDDYALVSKLLDCVLGVNKRSIGDDDLSELKELQRKSLKVHHSVRVEEEFKPFELETS